MTKYKAKLYKYRYIIGIVYQKSKIKSKITTENKKQVNHFKDNEVLEEFIAPPSYYFEILKNNKFVVEDFKESRCIDECKEIDEAYYNRFHEIPQFMGFLAKKYK